MILEHLRRFILFYASGAALLLGACVFAVIAEESRLRHWDDSVLRAFRSADDPALPRGPRWVASMMRDATALGGGVILTVTALATIGTLLLRRARRTALAITLACLGGVTLNVGLKALVERPRPAVVPAFIEATTTSFPSGHSLLSATIYLSIAGLLTLHASRRTAAFAIGLALLLTALVGVSRIFLGVHYPSDVLGGWIIGTAWSFLCIEIAARKLPPRGTAP